MYYVAFKNDVPIELTQNDDKVLALLMEETSDCVRSFQDLPSMIAYLQSSTTKVEGQSAQQTLEDWMEKITAETERLTNVVLDNCSKTFGNSYTSPEWTNLRNSLKQALSSSKKFVKDALAEIRKEVEKKNEK